MRRGQLRPSSTNLPCSVFNGTETAELTTGINLVRGIISASQNLSHKCDFCAQTVFDLYNNNPNDESCWR
jgi:hypothetical protein